MLYTCPPVLKFDDVTVFLYYYYYLFIILIYLFLFFFSDFSIYLTCKIILVQAENCVHAHRYACVCVFVGVIVFWETS